MSEFAIEKNVPLESRAYRGSECPYPFAQMSVGDSFFVSTENKSESSERTKVSSWIRRFRKQSGQRTFLIATRTVPGGFRVWRTS